LGSNQGILTDINCLKDGYYWQYADYMRAVLHNNVNTLFVVHRIIPRLLTYEREHKMKTAIFFLFVLTCCVIYFFYFLKNRSAQPPPNKKDKVCSKGFSPPASTKDAVPQSLNVPDKPLDRIGPLRSHVSDGIKYILSSYKPEDPKSPLPLQRPEIKPEVIAKVKNHVGDMKEFSSFDELSRLLDDPNVDMSKIAKKISMDPVLSNKILKVANSAYFGSNVSVDSINHALALLGLINIKAIMFHNAFSKKLSGAKYKTTPFISPCGVMRLRLRLAHFTYLKPLMA